MALNVLYEGVSLADGVEVRPGEDGLFLPLALPMPVGTRLSLERAGQGRQRVRVNRVVEGEQAGVYIAAEGASVFPLVEAAAVAVTAAPRPVEPELTVPAPPPDFGPAVVPAPAASVAAVPAAAVPEAALPEAAVPDAAVPEVYDAGMDFPEDRTVIMKVPPMAGWADGGHAASTQAADSAAEAAADPATDPALDTLADAPTEAAGGDDEAGPAGTGAGGGGAKKGRRGKRGGGRR